MRIFWPAQTWTLSGSPDSLLLALSRIYLLLPNSQRQEFLLRIPKAS